MEKKTIIFHGKSDITIKKKIANIIERIPTSERKMAVTHFRSPEGRGNKEEVSEALLSLPLGCSMQLVVVWQYLNFFSSDQVRKLIPYIPADTWAVLVSETSLPEGERKKLSKIPLVEVITEYFVKWDDLRQHLQNFFRSHHLQPDREVIDHLVKIFSDTPIIMDKELEKIAAFFSPNSEFTWSDLQGILVENQNEQMVYEVINQFFEKKPVESLRKFRQYLIKYGDLQVLLAMMIRELILIVKFKEMKSEGKSEQDIFLKIKVFYDKYKKSLKAKDLLFSYPDIIKILQECLVIDKDLRRESFTSLEVDKPKVSLKAKLGFERLITVVMNE